MLAEFEADMVLSAARAVKCWTKSSERQMDSAEERASKIAAIREFADFLEKHDNVPVPWMYESVYIDSKEALVEIIKGTGKWEKCYGSDSMNMKKEFGGNFTYVLVVNRESVCQKRQVGTRTVPARPAEEAHEEPVYEWICEPVLAEKENDG